MKTFIIKIRDRFHLSYYYVITGYDYENEALKRAIILHEDKGKPIVKAEIVKTISGKGFAVLSANYSQDNLLERM